MRLVKKILLILILSSLALGIIYYIALNFILTPEKFKSTIVQKIEQTTGYQAKFTDELTWHYLPHLTIHANQLQLINSKQPEDQINIQSIDLNIKLLPLLNGKLVLTGITIKQLDYQNKHLKQLNLQAKQFTYDQYFNLLITGKLTANLSTHSHTNFRIQTKTLIKKINKTNNNIQTIDFDPLLIELNNNQLNNNKAQGKLHLEHHEANTNKFKFNGELSADRWIISAQSINNLPLTELLLQHILLKFHGQDGMIIIDPLNTELYQGKLNSNIKINFQQKQTNYDIKLNLQQLALAELLKAWYGSAGLDGKLTGNIQLTAKGNTIADLLATSHGDFSGYISNGQLQFANINQLLTTAMLIVNQKTSKNNSLTLFDKLNITGQIAQGQVNLDIDLFSPSFNANGSGEINLIQQTVQLLIHAYYQKNETTKAIDLPIKIHGDLANPKISLASNSAAINNLTKQHKQELKKLANSLKNFFR